MAIVPNVTTTEEAALYRISDIEKLFKATYESPMIFHESIEEELNFVIPSDPSDYENAERGLKLPLIEYAYLSQFDKKETSAKRKFFDTMTEIRTFLNGLLAKEVFTGLGKTINTREQPLSLLSDTYKRLYPVVCSVFHHTCQAMVGLCKTLQHDLSYPDGLRWGIEICCPDYLNITKTYHQTLEEFFTNVGIEIVLHPIFKQGKFEKPVPTFGSYEMTSTGHRSYLFLTSTQFSIRCQCKPDQIFMAYNWYPFREPNWCLPSQEMTSSGIVFLTPPEEDDPTRIIFRKLEKNDKITDKGLKDEKDLLGFERIVIGPTGKRILCRDVDLASNAAGEKILEKKARMQLLLAPTQTAMDLQGFIQSEETFTRLTPKSYSAYYHRRDVPEEEVKLRPGTLYWCRDKKTDYTKYPTKEPDVSTSGTFWVYTGSNWVCLGSMESLEKEERDLSAKIQDLFRKFIHPIEKRSLYMMHPKKA